MSFRETVGYLASAVLIFLGVIFLLASAYAASRLLVGAVLAALGLGIAILTRKARAGQASVRYEVQLSGSLKAGSVKCPNCGAGLDPSTMRLKLGVPSIKCPYCGNEFEVTEEPKW